MPMTGSDTTPLAWAESRIQPYFDDSLTREQFLSCVVQTAAEEGFRSWGDEPCEVTVLVLSSDDDSASHYMQLLRTGFCTGANIKLKISTVDVEEARQLVSDMRGEAAAVVVGEHSTVASLLSLCDDVDHLYCVSHIRDTHTQPRLDQALRPLYTCRTQSGRLIFFKKIYNKSDFTIYKTDSQDWYKGLREIAEKNSSKHILIVTQHLTPREVLSALSMEPHNHKISTFFIQDNDAPPFSLSLSFYSSQLALGLPVNILSEGSWGSIRTLSLPLGPCTLNVNNMFTNTDEDLRFSCVGLNTRFFTSTETISVKEPELSCVDYSGTLRGQRVMGVAYLQAESSSVRPDSVLQWPVPADWTLEDAATVPVLYTLAYYCINHLADAQEGETVLVHAGMSLIGQAVISVALDVGARVIASVTDQQQASQLLNLFPGLHDDQVVVVGKENNLAAIMKRTKKVGVNVVISCLKGKSNILATLKTITRRCRYIYFPEIKIEDQEKLGMYIFLKGLSFIGVPQDSFKNASEECKLSLRQSLINGMNGGVVKPFVKRAYSLRDVPFALRSIQTYNGTEKTLIVSKAESEVQILNEYNRSKFGDLKIIAGENMKLNLKLAEKLLLDGSSNIVLLNNEDHKRSHYMKRINDILHLQNSTVITFPSKTLDTVESTAKLFEEILHIGPVSAILCVNMDENGHRMKNLDSASRQVLPQLQQFVSLLGHGTAVSDSRANSGLPVCSIRGEASIDATKVIPYLPSLLSGTQTSDNFYFVAESFDSSEINDEVDLLSFLPSSVEELFHLGEQEESRPRFVEEVTLSLPYSMVKRGILPVFIIPGIGRISIKPLVSRLMYPAFSCTLPAHAPPSEELAEILVQEILSIQDQGPYTIVGESWGGALALSVARLLEVREQVVSIVLIQGVPATMQANLRSLCRSLGAADPGTCVINAALNIQSEVVKHGGWRERLLELLKTLEPSVQEPVSRAVTALNNQLNFLLQFKDSSNKFLGNVVLIRYSNGLLIDLNNISKNCQRIPEIVTVDEANHRDLLASKATATALNEYTAFNY